MGHSEHNKIHSTRHTCHLLDSPLFIHSLILLTYLIGTLAAIVLVSLLARHTVTIKLSDKTHASLRYIDGMALITFHASTKSASSNDAQANRRVMLAKGYVPTISVIQALYNAYKGN